MSELSALYSNDYTAWAHKTAEFLRAGRFADLDIDHLLEELEGMGASERNELENRLRVLLAHLLKWQYQYQQLSDRWQEFDGRSWRNTLKTQRNEILFLFERKPGTKRFFEEAIVESYRYARVLAADETNLSLDTFPATCQYSQAQILDKDFYPPTE